MKELSGKTVFITGGAEGIGFHVGRALAGEGMRLMLADIDTEQLDKAVQTLKGEGFEVEGVGCDVALRSDLEAAAEKTVQTFGKVHMVINNAGVSVIGSQQRISEENWRWVIDVNLMGVVYGTQVFTPYVQSHGEGGHMINVASMAGMKGFGLAGPYSATKAAVISLSETWRDELEPKGIDVSVMCPAFIKSRIYDSARNRQQRYGGPVYFEEQLKKKPHLAGQKDNVVNGIDTEIAGRRFVEAIKNNEFYIFTHPHYKKVVDGRCEELKKGFSDASNSPHLKGVEKTGGFMG